MKYQKALTFSECRVKHLELEMCHQRKLSELSHNVLSAGIQKCVFNSRERIPDCRI